MWIVEPTVIIGRHQLLDTEVNTDYCRANGIDIVCAARVAADVSIPTSAM